MRGKSTLWAPLFLLLSISCGGGEEESPYEWRCYERTDFAVCECYEVTKGSSFSVGSSAMEVDDCGGYELCKSYYDTGNEQGRCDCGGADFEPFLNESRRRGTKTVDTCPVDD